jgi:hypothetical protein
MANQTAISRDSARVSTKGPAGTDGWCNCLRLSERDENRPHSAIPVPRDRITAKGNPAARNTFSSEIESPDGQVLAAVIVRERANLKIQ